MAFEVIAYYSPRASEAIKRSLFAPEVAVPAGVPPVQVELGSTPTRPFRRAWAPQQSWTRPPGDVSAAGVTPSETGPAWRHPTFRPLAVVVAFGTASDATLPVVQEPAVGSLPGRPAYRSWWVSPRLVGTAAYDDSTATIDLDDLAPVAQVVRSIYRKDYTAYIRMGREPGDLTHDPDTYVRMVGRPSYRVPFNAKPALDYCFNLANDDTFAVAAQDDQQSEIVQNVYRQPYNPRAALAFLLNHPAMDQSVVIGAQPEAVGTIVRNLYRESYDARLALIEASGNTPGDDSTAPVVLTGGVYVPTLRRRRR